MMRTEEDDVKVPPRAARSREGHRAQRGKGQELGLVLRVKETLRCQSSERSSGFLCGVTKCRGVRRWWWRINS